MLEINPFKKYLKVKRSSLIEDKKVISETGKKLYLKFDYYFNGTSKLILDGFNYIDGFCYKVVEYFISFYKSNKQSSLVNFCYRTGIILFDFVP